MQTIDRWQIDRDNVDFTKVYVSVINGLTRTLDPRNIVEIRPANTLRENGTEIVERNGANLTVYRVHESPQDVRAMAEGKPSREMVNLARRNHELARTRELGAERRALAQAPPPTSQNMRDIEKTIGALQQRLRENDNAIGTLNVGINARTQLLKTSGVIRATWHTALIHRAQSQRAEKQTANEQTAREIAAAQQRLSEATRQREAYEAKDAELREKEKPEAIEREAQDRTERDIAQAALTLPAQSRPIFREAEYQKQGVRAAFGWVRGGDASKPEIGYRLDTDAMDKRHSAWLEQHHKDLAQRVAEMKARAPEHEHGRGRGGRERGLSR